MLGLALSGALLGSLPRFISLAAENYGHYEMALRRCINGLKLVPKRGATRTKVKQSNGIIYIYNKGNNGRIKYLSPPGILLTMQILLFIYDDCFSFRGCLSGALRRSLGLLLFLSHHTRRVSACKLFFRSRPIYESRAHGIVDCRLSITQTMSILRSHGAIGTHSRQRARQHPLPRRNEPMNININSKRSELFGMRTIFTAENKNDSVKCRWSD